MFQHMFWRVCCLWLILGMWPGAVAWAQPERYELGKRLRRMEVAWQQAEPAGRVAAVKPMQKPSRAFSVCSLPRPRNNWMKLTLHRCSDPRPATFSG